MPIFPSGEEERARRRVFITRRVRRWPHAPSREPSRADASVFCLLVSLQYAMIIFDIGLTRGQF